MVKSVSPQSHATIPLESARCSAVAPTSSLLSEEDPLLTPKGVVEHLRSLGLPISASWFEKLCQADKGPPIDAYWGRRPMRKRSRVRAWAEERMRAMMTDQAA
jgi:hypothetical protein